MRVSEREEYVPRHMRPAGVMEPAPRPSKAPAHMGVAAYSAQEEAEPAAAPAHMRASERPASTTSADGGESESDRQARVGRSQLLISVCVAISRITGFIRTWAMGIAMGTTLLSSSYQVACNLPNQLYELVMGGMLVTAFLPVYVGLRKREGEERANQYASTLMGIVLVFLGVVALLATLFAPQVVWTQMFFSSSGDRELVVYFFRFFAVQLLFYGVSAVAGGLLNSRSDYFWSSAAPIANNIVVIFAMFVYYFVSADNPDFAKLVLAVGTPLGVFVQMAMQVPALAKNGVHLKPWRINLHDPDLRETLALGIPTLVVTLCSFATVSVQNAAAMAVSDAGSSVLYYARQWFTLPYAFLAVPVTTTLFTELAGMVADCDHAAVRRTIVSGTQQNFFSMVPFMLYLIVFAVPLVSLFRAGSFDWTSVELVSGYLAVMALSLPFYACFLFMQKVFSALRAMKQYAVCNLVVSVVQVVLTIVLCLGAGSWGGFGLAGVALAQIAFFVLGTVWCYVYLSKRLGGIGLKTLVGSFVSSLLVGAVGAAVGAVLLWALQAFVMPIEAGGIPWALACIVVGGLASLVVTYGLGVVLHVPGSAFIGRIVARFLPRKAN